jgi:hypothetical protein
LRHWALWEWIAYGALWMGALIVASETGFKTEPEVMARMPEFIHSAVWGFAPLVLVVLATVILLLRQFGWLKGTQVPAAPSYSNKKETIAKKHFMNERVVIDGKSFVECKFQNVTFVYNGTAPFDFISSEFRGFSLASDNPGINDMVRLLHEFHLLKIPLMTDGQIKAPTGGRWHDGGPIPADSPKLREQPPYPQPPKADQ